MSLVLVHLVSVESILEYTQLRKRIRLAEAVVWSFTMPDPECPMCIPYTYEDDFKLAAHPRAMRTAHELATKESEKVLPAGFDAIDVYMVFFPKIYKHELKRTMKILYARSEYARLLRNLDNPDVCGYCSETICSPFTGIRHYRSYKKKEEDEYRNSKWPKPLKD